MSTITPCQPVCVLWLLLAAATAKQEDDCRLNYGSNCLSNSTKCEPYSVAMDKRCDFVQCCCGEQLEDPILDYLRFEYCSTWSDAIMLPEVANALILTVVAIYYFVILGGIARDYFSVIMADSVHTLRVPHNIAGVTFLAFGNGSPDIFSSIAAIQQGGEQLKLGIGGLLGGAMFIPIIVSAVIATYAVPKPPRVARRPFVRDCIFLFLAVAAVLIIDLNGTVTIGPAIGMLVLYMVYVLSAVLTEIYEKMRAQHRFSVASSTARLTKRRVPTADHAAITKQSDDLKCIEVAHREMVAEPEQKTIAETVILPALGLFSNDSMMQIELDSCLELEPNAMSMDIHSDNGNESLVPGNYQSFGYGQLISASGSLVPVHVATKPTLFNLKSDGESRSSDLDSDAQQHVHDHAEYDRKVSISVVTMSEMRRSIWSERQQHKKRRPWPLRLALFLATIPALIIHYLCKITVPLTDEENWSDRIAVLSCVTAPLWILFGFDLLEICVTHWLFLWHLAVVFGLAMAPITVYMIRRKYRSAGSQQRSGDTYTAPVASSSYEVTMELTQTASTKPTLTAAPSEHEQPMGTSRDGHRKRVRKRRHDRKKLAQKEMEPKQQAVMRYFFLLLGFLSAVAWINVAANELVNILTTLGIVSQIDLAIVGLTVLAWGNCISDLVVDVGVSKKGYPKMGIAAAIGGPTLNVLIGIGLGTTIVCIREGSVDMTTSANILYACLAVMLAIIIYVATVAMSSWRITKCFGYFLYLYYVLFLLFIVLAYIISIT